MKKDSKILMQIENVVVVVVEENQVSMFQVNISHIQTRLDSNKLPVLIFPICYYSAPSLPSLLMRERRRGRRQQYQENQARPRAVEAGGSHQERPLSVRWRHYHSPVTVLRHGHSHSQEVFINRISLSMIAIILHSINITFREHFF